MGGGSNSGEEDVVGQAFGEAADEEVGIGRSGCRRCQ